ncbi:MAG: DUF288 domain-containing protein [Bacteroidia bacterium]|nr:DUF288 domain-containing protein [Bacteroidia bacterium]
MKRFVVITSIQDKTTSISKLEQKISDPIIIIGDKKSPPQFQSGIASFINIKQQNNLPFKIVRDLPFNHYSRKNIGYLISIFNGAEQIYETDDDNYPTDNWDWPKFSCDSVIRSSISFFNVYKYFSDTDSWPRGYPLYEVTASQNFEVVKGSLKEVGVWQGLVHNAPDVDAIYRLTNNSVITFSDREPIVLSKGVYCPFNSQNTFWTKRAFPLLYLPVTVNFRFTDILRSYITQRLLWDINMSLGFLSANAKQERNYHNLLSDFEDEVPGQLQTKELVEVLYETNTGNNIYDGLLNIYQALLKSKIVKANEIHLLDLWCNDISKILM